jgi:hypothetical protein
MKEFFRPVLFASLLSMVGSLHADVVWPALILEHRLNSLLGIILMFVLELIFVWRFTRLSILRSTLLTAILNSFSAFAGIILVPIIGLLPIIIFSPLAPYIVAHGALDMVLETINYGMLWFIAAGVSTTIEVGVLHRYVKFTKWPYPYSKKYTFTWLLTAHAIATAFAMASLWIWPIRT